MTRATLCLLLSTAGILSATGAAAQAPGAPGDDRFDRLLSALVEQGVLTRQKADAIAAELPAPATAAPATSPVVTAPAPALTLAAAQPEGGDRGGDPSISPSAPVVRNAARATAPDWTKRFKIDGDIRFRWQGEYFSNGTSKDIPNYNGLTGPTALPVTNLLGVDDRTRLRYRARFGFNANVTDRVSAVLRLAVGNETEPVSTDETLGDYFNRDDVVADRAYVRYAVNDQLVLFAGRMANPFYTTNMLWDGDVNPEGVAATFERPLGAASLFATGGVFAVQENADRTKDRYLYAGQVGVEAVKLWEGASAKLGLAYYDYTNIEGRVGEPGTHNLVLQKGNTLIDIDPRAGFILPALASRFRTLDLTGAVDQTLGDHVLTASFDLAKNLAYDANRFRGQPLLTEPGGDLAWLVSLTYGTPKVARRGDWQTTLSYRRIETDAVLAAFNEGDFNLGGTNTEGVVVDLVYGLTTNTSAQLTYMNTRSIVGPTYAFDALRMAFNTRF
ncbi:MAG: hypothetical protein JWO33_2053 [Caulobacteraceae bacterium]|nr:hypothetical protein [Caulobacteraceae bacterium]